jgi:hypothetical protein
MKYAARSKSVFYAAFTLVRKTVVRSFRETGICPAALATLVLCTLFFPCCVHGTRSPPAHVRASQQILAGDVEAGRAELRPHIDFSRSRLDAYRGKPPESCLELKQRASALGSAVGAVDIWMHAEVCLRVKEGIETPDDVVADIVSGATKLLEYTDLVLRATTECETERMARLAWVTIRSATQHFGNFLLRTVAFARGSALDGARAEILEKAKKFVPAPDTLAEFDAQSGDLEEHFDLSVLRRTPQKPGPSQPVELEADHPIAVLITNAFQAMYNGDLQTLKALCADDYWPENRFIEVAAKSSGWQIVETGRFFARDIGNGEMEVMLDHMEVLEPTGNRTTRGPVVIVRNVDGTGYQISFFGSKNYRDKLRQE